MSDLINPPTQTQKQQWHIDTQAGIRFDAFVCQMLPEHSRGQIQRFMAQGKILRNGQVAKASTRLQQGDSVLLLDCAVQVTHAQSQQWVAQQGELAIAHEDDALLVVDKPSGLVVYPAVGNHDNTLANFLLHYLPSLNQVPRAGIVHRLDKDTSGLLVVAKTLVAHTHLVAALQDRRVHRHYCTLVHGALAKDGTIETLLGRHPIHRQRQAVRTHGGKLARTHYERIECIAPCTLVAVTLDTGRTHQIRVHMSHIGHGVVGDSVYKAPVNWREVPEKTKQLLSHFPRQALHATRLQLSHPNGHLVDVISPLPNDMAGLIEQLRAMNAPCR